MSHTTGIRSAQEEGSVLHKAIGTCPEIVVLFGKTKVCCLLDTDAQVSIITESCFNDYFAAKEKMVDVASHIWVTAANGLSIPYQGYLEADVTTFDHTFKNMGFLVVENQPTQRWKK